MAEIVKPEEKEKKEELKSELDQTKLKNEELEE